MGCHLICAFRVTECFVVDAPVRQITRLLVTCFIKWQRIEDDDDDADKPPRIKPPNPPPGLLVQQSVPVSLHASTSPFPNELSHAWVSYRAII